MFDELYSSVMKNELGYNPDDQGAQTYNGIWYAAHPGWPGWKIINAIPNKKRGQTFYNIHPELEQLAKNFYADYWKPLQVEQLNSLQLAQMLADISTQHGGWKKIVAAGVYGGNPLTGPAVYSADTIAKLNSNPKLYYQQIAEKRLYYSTHVKLKNEADRKGIINRAQKYVTAAAKWISENSGTAAAAGTGIAGFFLLIC